MRKVGSGDGGGPTPLVTLLKGIAEVYLGVVGLVYTFYTLLAAIKQKKKSLTLNKPLYAGMCIVDLSKLHMYSFHYDVIKKQHTDRAKLLFTHTDSMLSHQN